MKNGVTTLPSYQSSIFLLPYLYSYFDTNIQHPKTIFKYIRTCRQLSGMMNFQEQMPQSSMRTQRTNQGPLRPHLNPAWESQRCRPFFVSNSSLPIVAQRARLMRFSFSSARTCFECIGCMVQSFVKGEGLHSSWHRPIGAVACFLSAQRPLTLSRCFPPSAMIHRGRTEAQVIDFVRPLFTRLIPSHRSTHKGSQPSLQHTSGLRKWED